MDNMEPAEGVTEQAEGQAEEEGGGVIKWSPQEGGELSGALHWDECGVA